MNTKQKKELAVTAVAVTTEVPPVVGSSTQNEMTSKQEALLTQITCDSDKEMAVLDYLVNWLSGRLFDNKLSKIKVTIQSNQADKGRGSYGWACEKVWIKGDEKTEQAHELNITAEALNHGFSQVFNTIVHELIHIYGFDNNIKTTSRQGRYHNKNFKMLCERFGMGYAKDDKIGIITPVALMSEEHKVLMKRFIASLPSKVNVDELFKYHRTEISKNKPHKKKTTATYTCPKCGMKFTAKKGLKLICGDCKVKLETDEDDDEDEEEA